MRPVVPFVVAALLASLSANGEPVRKISTERVRVADVVPSAAADFAAIDLGPAPPPGKSRLVAKSEVEGRVREAGLDPTLLAMPLSVRVVSASRRMDQAELARLAGPAIQQVLPPGVTLAKAEPTHDVLVAPCATVRAAEIQRPPRQKGSFRSNANVEIGCDQGATVHATIPVVLDVGDAAARPDVPRGGHVSLVVDDRSIRISAQGTTLADANVGDIVNAVVVSTNRVVKAKLVSRDLAEVIAIR